MINSSFISFESCGGVMRTPLIGSCLNAWSPVTGTVWEGRGGVALLKECFEVQKPMPGPVSKRAACRSGYKLLAPLSGQSACLPATTPLPNGHRLTL